MADYDHTVGDTLKSAVRDAQDLVRDEIALARAELRDEIRRFGAGAMALAAAAAAALIAVVFVLSAVAWGIASAMAWPVWTGFAIVGVIVGLAAAVLAAMGRRRFNGERHMPLTIETMKENMQWMRGQRT